MPLFDGVWHGEVEDQRSMFLGGVHLNVQDTPGSRVDLKSILLNNPFLRHLTSTTSISIMNQLILVHPGVHYKLSPLSALLPSVAA